MSKCENDIMNCDIRLFGGWLAASLICLKVTAWCSYELCCQSLFHSVAAWCSSSQRPTFRPCSPQSLQWLSGYWIRIDCGGSWVQNPIWGSDFSEFPVSSSSNLISSVLIQIVQKHWNIIVRLQNCTTHYLRLCHFCRPNRSKLSSYCRLCTCSSIATMLLGMKGNRSLQD